MKLTIYRVVAEDLMDSTFSFNLDEIGAFQKKADAERCRDEYNRQLSPNLRKTAFAASIVEVEVR